MPKIKKFFFMIMMKYWLIKVKIFFCELDSIFVHDATFCFCLNLIVPLQRGDTCEVKELVPSADAATVYGYLLLLFWKSISWFRPPGPAEIFSPFLWSMISLLNSLHVYWFSFWMMIFDLYMGTWETNVFICFPL